LASSICRRSRRPTSTFETNLGLRDVLFALNWVRDKRGRLRRRFPGRVTLFGESAGAGMVTTLLASPAAAGLFSAAHRTELTRDVDLRRRPLTRGLPSSSSLRWASTTPAGLAARRPTAAVLAASKQVFDEGAPCAPQARWPSLRSSTATWVPDYPVVVARAGGTHAVPLLIGTNKHEAALFRFMKSPLLPITPQAIKAMFAEIASEQPGLQLPTEEELGRHLSRPRPRPPGMGSGS